MIEQSPYWLVLAIFYLAIEFFLPKPSGKTSARGFHLFAKLAAHVASVGAALFLAGANGAWAWVMAWVVCLYCLKSLWHLGNDEADTSVRLVGRHATGLVMIVGAWVIGTGQVYAFSLAWASLVLSTQVLATAVGCILVTRPASQFVASVLRPWIHQVDISEGSSLGSAGKAIGYLERILIVMLIHQDQWEGIAFLLAAKGILRFNEISGKNSRAVSEYVVLGTLLSFLVAIVVGAAVKSVG